jgi:GNAT superfamily N-acetyltransferase
VRRSRAITGSRGSPLDDRLEFRPSIVRNYLYVDRMSTVEAGPDGYRIEPLGPLTWDAFADLAERHNGVWGGCWCTWFHLYPDCPERKEIGNRAFKRRLVDEGRAHAALVFDGDVAVAWCEYGTVEELPNIHHRKQWEQGVVRMPDYRITCLFVDRRYRRKGMAAVAVRGALELIGAAGGGLVESYPHDLAPGKRPSASFLYNATRSMYEKLGFSYDRPKGKGNCVMSKSVPAG